MTTDESGGKKRGLGRGLSSLLGEEQESGPQLDQLRQSRNVPIEQLRPGVYQPRREFGEEELASLAESIREKGVIQPILVRRSDDDGDSFEIIAGERRWRAAQIARLHEVPVLVREFDDREALEIALIENVQRQDLSALEEAAGYQRLIDEFGHTQEEISQAVGKSRSHVANTLRLMSLSDGVATYLEKGQISPGHARALLVADDADTLVEEVVRKGLNVRQTETLVRRGPPVPKAPRAGRAAPSGVTKDADTLALEKSVAEHTGLKTDIVFSEATGSGSITLYYQDVEQLDMIVSRLSDSHGPQVQASVLDQEPGFETSDDQDEEPLEDDFDLSAFKNGEDFLSDDVSSGDEEPDETTPDTPLGVVAEEILDTARGGADDDDEGIDVAEMMSRMNAILESDEDEAEDGEVHDPYDHGDDDDRELEPLDLSGFAEDPENETELQTLVDGDDQDGREPGSEGPNPSDEIRDKIGGEIVDDADDNAGEDGVELPDLDAILSAYSEDEDDPEEQKKDD